MTVDEKSRTDDNMETVFNVTHRMQILLCYWENIIFEQTERKNFKNSQIILVGEKRANGI